MPKEIYEDMLKRLDTDFLKYTANYDYWDGMGVEMIYYDANGEVNHSFYGHIYDIKNLQEIAYLLAGYTP